MYIYGLCSLLLLLAGSVCTAIGIVQGQDGDAGLAVVFLGMAGALVSYSVVMLRLFNKSIINKFRGG